MASVNTPNKKRATKFTHEGARATHGLSKASELQRTVSACLLWEDSFYEDGVSIADRIKTLVHATPIDVVGQMAVDLRDKHGIRHAPLLMVREMLRHPQLEMQPTLVQNTVSEVCVRPDDMCELLALYWGSNDGKRALSAQLKKGLADAFCRYNEYQLAKWNRTKKEVTLKDILRIVHPKAPSKHFGEMWGRLAKDELATPNTWETRLSAGEDKKEVFTDLLKTEKLGGLALLRNLRNMVDSNVDRSLVKQALKTHPFTRVLPFRFIAAAAAAPGYTPELSDALVRAAETLPKLDGLTHVVIDNSGSMGCGLSQRSDLRRVDAAIGMGILCANVCEDVRIWLFSNDCTEVAAHKNLALFDVQKQHPMGGTDLERAVHTVFNESGNAGGERLIVITDEQTWTNPTHQNRFMKSYLINIATFKHGVGYPSDGWSAHVDGFSERILAYISSLEA